MKKTYKTLTAILSIVMILTVMCQPINASAKSAKPIVKATQTVISKGMKTKVKVTYNKKNVTNKAKFKSSNKKVATVSKKGVVTGKKAGTAYITATYKGKTSKKVKITVAEISLNKSKVKLNVGKTATLVAKYNKKKVNPTFKSSNPNIASVNKSGKITAKKKGTVTITATYKKSKVSCKVTVSEIENECASGHAYNNGIITKEPTCMEGGVKTYTCTRCSKTKSETVKALDHAYDNGTIAKQPTCTEGGVKTYTCTRCGEIRTETIAKLGHAYDNGTITKQSTCTEDGVKTYTCTRCHETKSETVKALGHAWDAGVITKEPTDTESGVKTYTCEKCGDTKDENGHYEKQEVAGWDEEKLVDVNICNTCKMEFSTEEYGSVEAALDALCIHQLENWESDCEGYHTETRTIIIHHDPTYEDVWVADK